MQICLCWATLSEMKKVIAEMRETLYSTPRPLFNRFVQFLCTFSAFVVIDPENIICLKGPWGKCVKGERLLRVPLGQRLELSLHNKLYVPRL